MKSNIETFLRLKPNDSNTSGIYNQNENNISSSNYTDISFELRSPGFIEIKIPDEMRKGYVNNLKKNYEFKFTGIFDKTSTQEEVFDSIGEKVIKHSIQGYNNTVFCYGQTGSGKTYTMCGSKNWKERGLIPRILIELFKYIRSIKDYSYDIFISYLEIYNENAYDLLDRHHSEIDIETWRKIIVYEDNYGNIMLKNLSMIKAENEQQALDLWITGNYIRQVSSTPMNLASSRSHAIFSIVLEGRELNSEVMRVSKINLVDLAGSERLRSSSISSSLIETKYINLSLSFLEQVIIALNEKANGVRTHIPYRNSLMTIILKDSLGGNCKTILVANVSSDLENLDETISTMRFAVRCARVENEISVNEHMDLNILVSKLNSENNELRRKLEVYQNKEFLEILSQELSPYEKDECKFLISEYLNDASKNKKINAKNANQLHFIIDFLIEYINNKERVYKEKITEILSENKELIQIVANEESNYQKISDVICKNKLNSLFAHVSLTCSAHLQVNNNDIIPESSQVKSDGLPNTNEEMNNKNIIPNHNHINTCNSSTADANTPPVYSKSFAKCASSLRSNSKK